MARQARREYRFSFTFLIYPSDIHQGKFVAHCLELDVVAVESNRPRAIALLKQLIEDLIQAAIKDDTLGTIFTPAPPEYWQALARAEPYEPPERIKQRRIAADCVRHVDYAFAPA